MPALRRVHENPGSDQSARGYPEDTRVPASPFQTPADRFGHTADGWLLFFLIDQKTNRTAVVCQNPLSCSIVLSYDRIHRSERRRKLTESLSMAN
jgi:hypothetical protein